MADNTNIPVAFCFNNAYSIPGAVCIWSLLHNSSPDKNYNLHILHSDISDKHKTILNQIVSGFKNATLEFHDMGTLFTQEFSNVGYQAYWSKELFYKCILCSVFPQLERIVISDVDAVFCDDLSQDWDIFTQDETNYLAGYTCLHKRNHSTDFGNMIYKDWSADDRNKVLTCAGLWMFNLKLMRSNNLEARMLQFIKENLSRLTQPEQQVVNMICYPNIHLFHPRGMIMAWDYDIFKTTQDYENERKYSADVVRYSLKHPIQLHFAGSFKPWNTFGTTKNHIWWFYLLRTNSLKCIIEALLAFCFRGKHLEYSRSSFRKYMKHSPILKRIHKCVRKCFPRNASSDNSPI